IGIGSGKTVFARYMLPIIPFVCLLAAIAVSWLAARIRLLPVSPRASVLAVAGLTALAGSLSVARAFAFDRLVSRDDNRVAAARMLETMFPAPTTAYQFGTDYARLQLPPRFQVWIPDPALNPMDAPAAALPEIVIVPSSRLPIYTPPPAAEIYEILRRRYKPLARFDAEVQQPANDLVYDPQDAFFVPLTGFASIRRPGPAIDVFRLEK
ncbi:MAG: hypothetical protein Q7R41_10810, partial [Phycisphaerales bacterium]|nr:hypothetical protein [Phycisphaerales bacterium]